MSQLFHRLVGSVKIESMQNWNEGKIAASHMLSANRARAWNWLATTIDGAFTKQTCKSDSSRRQLDRRLDFLLLKSKFGTWTATQIHRQIMTKKCSKQAHLMNCHKTTATRNYVHFHYWIVNFLYSESANNWNLIENCMRKSHALTQSKKEVSHYGIQAVYFAKRKSKILLVRCGDGNASHYALSCNCSKHQNNLLIETETWPDFICVCSSEFLDQFDLDCDAFSRREMPSIRE